MTTLTVRNIVAHVVGLLLLVAGFGWLYLDVRPDGHVEISTAIGAALLVLAGAWLIDKATTIALVAWLKDQAQSAFSISRTPPPSGGAS